MHLHFPNPNAYIGCTNLKTFNFKSKPTIAKAKDSKTNEKISRKKKIKITQQSYIQSMLFNNLYRINDILTIYIVLVIFRIDVECMNLCY